MKHNNTFSRLRLHRQNVSSFRHPAGPVQLQPRAPASAEAAGGVLRNGTTRRFSDAPQIKSCGLLALIRYPSQLTSVNVYRKCSGPKATSSNSLMLREVRTA